MVSTTLAPRSAGGTSTWSGFGASGDTSMHPRDPKVITTDFAPISMIRRAAASASASVSVGIPVISAASVSLGHTTSHSVKSSGGSGAVGAGAELKTVKRPAARPARSAATVVGTGTSSCVRSTRAPSKAPPAAATSAAESSPFAPGTMMMTFSPASSTVICATPVAASGVRPTCAVSTPIWRKLSR